MHRQMQTSSLTLLPKEIKGTHKSLKQWNVENIYITFFLGKAYYLKSQKNYSIIIISM